MQKDRLHVLFLSELFPNPAWPAFGIFVEHQAYHLSPHCDVTVVAPVRVFPHLRLWKHVFAPQRFWAEWRKWRADLAQIPSQGEVNGMPVFYPRYTSPPRQGFHGLWGFFAYPCLRGQLMALHRRYNFDLVHAHYASPCGVIALLARGWMRVPIVLSIHGADVTYTARQNSISATVVRWVFRNVEAIIANSTWTARQIVRYGGNPEKVRIVGLGGDVPKETCWAVPSSQDSVVSLLSVGYLEERKGHAYVLRAIKQLRDEGYRLHYTIVGDGSRRESLEALAETLDIAAIVSFEGYKPHSEVWPYFAGCNIFVLPSWNEAFGVVYIEALGLGKPVVGCEGEGGPDDLSSLGDCIELVKPRNVESLVQALKRLLDDPERRQRMGETGREIVAERFTWERNAANTLAIYKQMLGSRYA